MRTGLKSHSTKLFLVLTLFLFSFKTNGGEEELSVIKSPDGFLFVFNQPKENILFEINGTDFLEIETEELIFSVDKYIFQFVFVPIKEFFTPSKVGDTLLQHFQYESNFIKSTYQNQNINFKKEFITTSNARRYLRWSFEPKINLDDTASNTIIKHIIASFSTPNYILTISSPLTRIGDQNVVYKKINHIITTLNYSSNNFDLDSIRNSLQSIDKGSKK